MMTLPKWPISTAIMGLMLACPLSYGAEDHSRHGTHDTGASEHLHHQHGKDSWMLEYRFMRMNMNGSLDGTGELDNQDVFDAGYSMTPASMSMEMHMFMAMYGLTDTLSVMSMFHYASNRMKMAASGTATHDHGDMLSSGSGDTTIYAMYQPGSSAIFSLGLGLPTGSIDERTSDNDNNLPFAMQLGSGTLDVKPSFTLNLKSENWVYGGQATYTYRTGTNQNGYTLGHRIDASVWAKYLAGESLFVSSRLAVSNWGKITGSDSEMISATITPAANPATQGGSRLDALLGVSGMTENGSMLGLEMGLPVYQNLNGPQMKMGLIANASLQIMF